MSLKTFCLPLCAYCCFFFLPFIFQTVGLFTPKWASNATCDSIGLMYSCCNGSDNVTCGNAHGGDELDVRALGLHATSFALMVLAMVFLFCGVSCACGMCHNQKCYAKNEGFGVKKCREICDKLIGTILHLIAFLSFSIAGLFSIIGCIIVSTKVSTSQLGYSFYLTLTAGCLIIMLAIIVCIMECKNGQSDYESLPGTDSPSDGSTGTASTQRISSFMNKSVVGKLLESSRINRPS